MECQRKGLCNLHVVVDLNTVTEGGEPALGCDRYGTQHTRAVEFVVVAVIEMPRLPGDQRLALDLHDRHFWIGSDDDDARQRVAVDPLNRLDRVLLQWAEHLTEFH